MTRALLVLACLVSASPLAAPRRPPPAEPPQAPVEDPATRAAQLKAQGDTLLEAGRPVEALLAYEDAWRLNPVPELLYNRARCYEKVQQFPQALDALEQFALKADPALKARVPRLDALLASYRQKTTRLFITVEAGGVEVRLGDRILGKSPLPQPLVVNAGPAESLSLVSEAWVPVSRLLTLPGGADVHVQLPLASRDSRSVLQVDSPQVGALVTVDDGAGEGEVGNVPLDAVVQPGPHRVRLTKDGFVPASTSVLVQAGEARVLSIALEPQRPLVTRWYFWAAVGAAVAAGVAVGVAWTIERPAPRGSLNVGEPPITPAALPRF